MLHIEGNDHISNRPGLLQKVANLQEAVPFSIQGPLTLQHELVLLWVYVFIGKVNRQAL